MHNPSQVAPLQDEYLYTQRKFVTTLKFLRDFLNVLRHCTAALSKKVVKFKLLIYEDFLNHL